MPVGTTRMKDKREYSASERKVVMVPKQGADEASSRPVAIDQAEKERREAEQARIREMYGDASANRDAAAAASQKNKGN